VSSVRRFVVPRRLLDPNADEPRTVETKTAFPSRRFIISSETFKQSISAVRRVVVSPVEGLTLGYGRIFGAVYGRS